MASKQKQNNIKAIVIAISIVAVLVATMILINILNKIPDNDPNEIGNTAGNLNNSGFFCEANDGLIYFSNAYDSGSLYSMNPDQSNIKKLYDGKCQYINSGGDYIYFSMSSAEGGNGLGYVLKTSGIYRAKKNGKKITAISEDPSVIMTLRGNDLFYQGKTGEGIGLKRLDVTEGKPKAEIIENTYVINPACIVGTSIYYCGTQKDHYLYELNTINYNTTSIWGGNVWNPVYENGYFYYMDISNNYCICRYSPTNQTVDILTTDRVDTFNVGYGYVYYSTSTSSTPGIYRMNVDGSANELIMEGIFTDINMTSTYTYFHAFEKNAPMYCIPTTGANYPTEFVNAQTAVKNK